MQETKLEVGAIFEGKVTGITKFGAFVDLGGGKTGMVHISEVAPVFVKEIRDFVTEGQTVKVKIIGINDDGKISLSMKKADENAQQQRPPRRREDRPPRQNYTRRESTPPVQSPARPGDYEWRARENSGSFEDMMSRFKQMSDEKISDLKRAENKRGGYSRKGPRNG
ncbi:S1 RNA-binding domain-containing protein [Anaeromassilibacillus senegalensis]|uniref:S1 RNA-binding domain-containing protein n=1 Tax=Anaeromassilibacillus senegalensis TaxID=1673717 RepID=A0ABS9CJQ7_9FIRM|nr:S1 RNA-binding domain-containing protein [Anaeromassilibacillus senegalensis]MCF2651168.1 S1 RNA-binding domain-containing protein [Anaeromassilibacillus senegalensis]MCI5650864.1 S1 RNA-binding domain-containing protein [Ruminococcus bromii]MDD7646518.1 S1 RNA-binding domain-containing protein [Ruminococcus bromii]